MNWKEVVGLLALGFSGGCVFSATLLSGIKQHVTAEVSSLASFIRTELNRIATVSIDTKKTTDVKKTL